MAPTDEPVPLRDYVDMRFAASIRETDNMRIAMEHRLDGMNEFRQTLSDNSRMFMPRAECEAALRQLALQFETINKQVNARDERGQGMSSLWGIIVGIIGVASLIATILIRSKP